MLWAPLLVIKNSLVVGAGGNQATPSGIGNWILWPYTLEDLCSTLLKSGHLTGHFSLVFETKEFLNFRVESWLYYPCIWFFNVDYYFFSRTLSWSTWRLPPFSVVIRGQVCILSCTIPFGWPIRSPWQKGPSSQSCCYYLLLGRWCQLFICKAKQCPGTAWHHLFI